MFGEHDAGRGQRLRALRLRKAETQAEVAIKAGVNTDTVKRAEAGRPLSAETVKGLCAAYDVTVAELLGPTRVETTPDGVAEAGERLVSSTFGWVREKGWIGRTGAMMVVAGLGFATATETLAWLDQPTSEFATRLLHVGTLFALKFALVPVAWRAYASGARVRRIRMSALAATLVAVAVPWWSFGVFVHDARRAAGDTEAATAALAFYQGRAMALRSSDPTRDVELDRYWLTNFVNQASRQDAADYDTPGVWKARVSRRRSCAAEYLASPVYDHAACDVRAEVNPASRWTTLARVVTGGPMGPTPDVDMLSRRLGPMSHDGRTAMAD